MRICVDFDNTIWDGKKVLDGCIETLTRLHEKYVIAIYSARPTQAERTQMILILAKYKVPYDVILDPKPDAEFYIDDKNLLPNWQEIANRLAP